MSLLCKVVWHKADQYGSQWRIADPYHDGIGRSHRVVEAKCIRCGKYFRVGSVIDDVTRDRKYDR